MTERLYRDPVHNIIAISTREAAGALLIDLVDSPEFQRLRRIRQLGLAMYTYQGAEHSRFTHSLGVMHVMRRVLDRLAERNDLSHEVCVTALVAALLHDIGHGPFSHVIEKVLGMVHEDWTIQILLCDDTIVNRVLAAYDPELPQRVVDVYRYDYEPAFVCQLVSSQFDVDRCDYLLRDSLMTGAEYGYYDLEWILRHLELDREHQRLYVGRKGLFAIEEYLQARVYMFRQVYFHRSLRSAEAILKSIIRRAVELYGTDQLLFREPGSVLDRVLRREPLTVAQYLQLDDHDMMFSIKRWAGEPDRILADLCRRFLNRELFKTVDLDLTERRDEFAEEVRRLVAEAGWAPEYYFLRDSASDIPYYHIYDPSRGDEKSAIYVETGGPGSPIREISEVSHVVRGLRKYGIERLCFPAEVAPAVRSFSERFGVTPAVVEE